LSPGGDTRVDTAWDPPHSFFSGNVRTCDVYRVVPICQVFLPARISDLISASASSQSRRDELAGRPRLSHFSYARWRIESCTGPICAGVVGGCVTAPRATVEVAAAEPWVFASCVELAMIRRSKRLRVFITHQQRFDHSFGLGCISAKGLIQAPDHLRALTEYDATTSRLTNCRRDTGLASMHMPQRRPPTQVAMPAMMA